MKIKIHLEARAGRVAERPHYRARGAAGVFVSVPDAVAILANLSTDLARQVEDLVDELAAQPRAVLAIGLLKAVVGFLRRARRRAVIEAGNRMHAKFLAEQRARVLAYQEPAMDPEELAEVDALLAGWEAAAAPC